MSVFGSMASALSAVSDRTAEVDSQEKAAAAIEDRFVYDYPSAMLRAAVTAHLEFNRSNYRQTQSVVVVVRNRRTGKCAVFASQKEAGKCLGNIPPRFITEKILSGYCAKKDLQFVGVSSEADGVDFEDRVFQDPRRQSAHLLVTDIATGMRYLHQSIRSVSLRHDIDGTTVRRMIANRTGRNTKRRYKIEVATMEDIIAHFPTYVPGSFRQAVAADKDPAKFLASTYEESWGLSVRIHPKEKVMDAWNRVRQPYLLKMSLENPVLF